MRDTEYVSWVIRYRVPNTEKEYDPCTPNGAIIARVIDKSMSVGSRLSCSFSPGKCKCNNDRHTFTFVLGYHPGCHKSGLQQVLQNILHDYGSTINDLFGGSLSIRIAWSNILPPAHVRLRKL